MLIPVGYTHATLCTHSGASLSHTHTHTLQLLDGAGADAFAMADNGRTPLLEAAAAGSAACIRYLAESCYVPVKEEVVPDDSETGEHALLLAARGGHAGAAAALLELGAKVNRVDKEGRSALWEAARWAISGAPLLGVGIAVQQSPVGSKRLSGGPSNQPLLLPLPTPQCWA